MLSSLVIIVIIVFFFLFRNYICIKCKLRAYNPPPLRCKHYYCSDCFNKRMIQLRLSTCEECGARIQDGWENEVPLER
jgi:hypothetical protein